MLAVSMSANIGTTYCMEEGLNILGKNTFLDGSYFELGMGECQIKLMHMAKLLLTVQSTIIRIKHSSQRKVSSIKIFDLGLRNNS